MEKMFETAIRNKFRFAYKGSITVEDLWDLNINQLDLIYKDLMSESKKANEESLLATKSKNQEVIEVKIAIIKYIVNSKIEQMNEIKKEKEVKEQKQKIMSILNDKQDESLKNKSVEELQEMLKTL